MSHMIREIHQLSEKLKNIRRIGKNIVQQSINKPDASGRRRQEGEGVGVVWLDEGARSN